MMTSDDWGKYRDDHPDTSKEAAMLTDGRSQRDRLYALLVAAGPDGLTCHAAALQMDKSPNQVATRMEELREADRAFRLNTTRETTPGYRAHVHVADCWVPEDESLLYQRKNAASKTDKVRLAALEAVAAAAAVHVQTGDLMSLINLEAALAALEQ